MAKIAARIDAPKELTQALQSETTTLMITLMAEDVYLNLIEQHFIKNIAKVFLI